MKIHKIRKFIIVILFIKIMLLKNIKNFKKVLQNEKYYIQKSHLFNYTKHESFKHWINIVSYISNKIIDILSIRIKN